MTFVTTIPLRPISQQLHILDKRFRLAKQVYNSCLNYALDIADNMRQSKAWQEARKMPASKKRSEAFLQIRKDFNWSKYNLLNYKTRFTSTYFNEHLDSKVCATLAVRAFNAVNSYLLGIRGRPKFVREINSVEGETNQSPLRWHENKIKWYGLTLEPILDDRATIQHGLDCRVKYVRLIRKVIRGKIRYFAQLINEGEPLSVPIGSGVVGLDIGPSTIAVVSDNRAFLKLFCEELEDISHKIRIIQRQIARQRRLANPDNYEPDFLDKNGKLKKGKSIKGKRNWIKSNRQKDLESKLRELNRKQAEHRKNLHGRLINEIVSMGDIVNLEKLSYVAFQKLYGKSVGKRAPGMFVGRLRQKQIVVNEFPTRNTKLSQIDHKNGRYTKKKLSQRVHYFEDGEVVQRDLYSAFLATCVEDNELNIILAQEKWADVKPLLDMAWADVKDNSPSSMGKRDYFNVPR